MATEIHRDNKDKKMSETMKEAMDTAKSASPAEKTAAKVSAKQAKASIGAVMQDEVKRFDVELKKATGLGDLRTVYSSISGFASRLETTSVLLTAKFWHRTFVVVEELKHAGQKIRHQDVAEKLGVDRSLVSKMFGAVNEKGEDYLPSVEKGEITADGKKAKSAAGGKREKRTPVQRAAEHIKALKNIYAKASAEEQAEIRKLAGDELESVFRSSLEGTPEAVKITSGGTAVKSPRTEAAGQVATA